MSNLLHNILMKPNFLCHGSRLDKDTQSSAELTLHLTLLRTESGLATFETVSDCKKECVRDNINNF